MKLDDGFILRNIAGDDILVPVGSKVIEFKGIMTVTEVGVHIFQALKENKSPDEILASILSSYEIDEATARKDMEEFFARLSELGILKDE